MQFKDRHTFILKGKTSNKLRKQCHVAYTLFEVKVKHDSHLTSADIQIIFSTFK